jgi:hypothetical protein
LIFKKGDTSLLKNYRPISLAASDYKILAFILVNRLQKVIGKIVSYDQNAYIKGRIIGNNIRLVDDIIDYINTENNEGILLTIDFKKAFDSLEWSFMFESLKKFNFGNDFLNWVKVIYTSPIASVQNNGWLSEDIHLERGIKQGCPISALLSILAAETLSLKIKQTQDI